MKGKGKQVGLFARRELTPEAERLLANWEVVAGAQGGVKRLRELILEMAVKGKLVPQNPGDEPASALVTRIAITKSQLSGKKPIHALSDVEKPYSLPEGWQWIRLGDCGYFMGGGTPSKSNPSFWQGPIPWVSPKDMKRPYIDDAEDHISKAAVENSAVKLIPSGALLFVVRGMILAHSFPTALTTKEVTINQDMKALVLAIPEVGEYLLRACQAGRLRMLQRVERSSHGTCRLESEEVERFPISLPPLAEQKRIVAKVDELMKLCDDLEARQAKQRETAARLNKAALDALTSAEGPEELATSWGRIVEDLPDSPDGVIELRKTILKLATRGMLVEQDPADKKASTLMMEVAAERKRLVVAGLCRDSAPLPSITDDEVPHALPDSWIWMRLGTLGHTQTGTTPSPANATLWGDHAPFVTPGDILNGKIRATSKHLSKDGLSEGRAVPAGSVMMVCIGGSIGKAAQNDQIASCNQQINVIHPFHPLSASFILLALLAPYFQQAVVERAGQGTLPIISKSKWEQIPVPVPPLAEQKRIVAKVDHLLALCDTLEQKLRQHEDAARKVADALVAELLA